MTRLSFILTALAATLAGCGAITDNAKVVTFAAMPLDGTRVVLSPAVTADHAGAHLVRWELVASGEVAARTVRDAGDAYLDVGELRYSPNGVVADEHVIELDAGQAVTVRAQGPLEGIELIGGYLSVSAL